jgi:CrcB protein
MNYLLVFIGGGLGASLRHAINMICARGLGTAFPYGTFIINITGSTVMGLIAGYLAFKGEASQPWRLFLMTGILGGYTTALRARRDRACTVLRAGVGGVFDRRPVRRARAGSPSDVNRWPSPWQSRMGLHEARMGSVTLPFASLRRRD